MGLTGNVWLLCGLCLGIDFEYEKYYVKLFHSAIGYLLFSELIFYLTPYTACCRANIFDNKFDMIRVIIT